MLPITPFNDFKTHFEAGYSQIVWQWIPADLETPVSALLKLAGHEPYSFLLESVEGGATLGRYSAIGLNPDLLWNCLDQKITIEQNGETLTDDKAPLESLRGLLDDCKIDVVAEDMPPMSSSGLFGYLGYDCIRWVEDIPADNPDTLNVPDSIMMRPTQMVLFDNVKNMMCLSTPVRAHANNTDQSAEDIYAKAVTKVEELFDKINTPLDPTILHHNTVHNALPEIESNMTREDFHGMVNQASEYIKAGEIFQAVLSQRFSIDFDLPAFDLYRSLRRLNPSPFLFYVNFDGFALVGSSPEILVRLRDNTVTVRPIAGTRKRGKNNAEDAALAADLLSDAKECSEHLMLLDLGRNDIGRVADPATVDVTAQFTIEYYSHVMHIVSNVEGRLKDTMDSLDALMAGFPAGTVSGAPKIRAMQIIDELEPVKRSFYAGGVGYLDGNGDLDTCIALRTGMIKDGKLYVQAGGGVVADSDPELEYQESNNKARAVLQAAEDTLNLANRKAN